MLHLFPVFTHLVSAVGEKIGHATQQHLRVVVCHQFSSNNAFVGVLWSFLQACSHIRSRLLSFSCHLLLGNLVETKVFGRRAQDLSGHVICKFIDCFLCFFIEHFWICGQFDDASLKSYSFSIWTMDVRSISGCVRVERDSSADAYVFLQARNKQFEFFSHVLDLFVLGKDCPCLSSFQYLCELHFCFILRQILQFHWLLPVQKSISQRIYELNKKLAFGNKVGFAVDFEEDGLASAGGEEGGNDAFPGFLVGPFVRSEESLVFEPRDSLFVVAVSLLQGLLAVSHGSTRLFSELLQCLDGHLEG